MRTLAFPSSRFGKHHVSPSLALSADTELHVFGDAAANIGHEVAAYARTPVGDNGTFEMNLLFTKSHINPKRDITVPRLELVASLLCAQTADMLHKELGVAKGKIFCYSDYETALWWLTKPHLHYCCKF